MTSLTLSLSLAGGGPGDDPLESPEKAAAAEGECACGRGAPGSERRGLTPFSRRPPNQERRDLPPPALPLVATVPQILR